MTHWTLLTLWGSGRAEIARVSTVSKVSEGKHGHDGCCRSSSSLWQSRWRTFSWSAANALYPCRQQPEGLADNPPALVGQQPKLAGRRHTEAIGQPVRGAGL